MVLGKNESVSIVIGIVVSEWREHLLHSEGGVCVGHIGGTANMDGIVLREHCQHPRNIVLFMLSWAQVEVKDAGPQKGADYGLLAWRNDAGMDGSIHELVLDGIEAIGENVIVLHDTHITGNSCWRHICMSSQ